MTVLGGLQFRDVRTFAFWFRSFNTDDGIRRAAIWQGGGETVLDHCFNTDDGIRRAAIVSGAKKNKEGIDVSIPMTVLGGLQFPAC